MLWAPCEGYDNGQCLLWPVLPIGHLLGHYQVIPSYGLLKETGSIPNCSQSATAEGRHTNT